MGVGHLTKLPMLLAHPGVRVPLLEGVRTALHNSTGFIGAVERKSTGKGLSKVDANVELGRCIFAPLNEPRVAIAPVVLCARL